MKRILIFLSAISLSTLVFGQYDDIYYDAPDKKQAAKTETVVVTTSSTRDIDEYNVNVVDVDEVLFHVVSVSVVFLELGEGVDYLLGTLDDHRDYHDTHSIREHLDQRVRIEVLDDHGSDGKRKHGIS